MSENKEIITLEFSKILQMMMITLVGGLMAWTTNAAYSTSIDLARVTGRLERVEREVVTLSAHIERLRDHNRR